MFYTLLSTFPTYPINSISNGHFMSQSSSVGRTCRCHDLKLRSGEGEPHPRVKLHPAHFDDLSITNYRNCRSAITSARGIDSIAVGGGYSRLAVSIPKISTGRVNASKCRLFKSMIWKMAEMNDRELDEIYAFAVQLGKDAGEMLMAVVQGRIDGGADAGSSSVSYVEKENSVDIVTKTDNGTYTSQYGCID